MTHVMQLAANALLKKFNIQAHNEDVTVKWDIKHLQEVTGRQICFNTTLCKINELYADNLYH